MMETIQLMIGMSLNTKGILYHKQIRLCSFFPLKHSSPFFSDLTQVMWLAIQVGALSNIGHLLGT